MSNPVAFELALNGAQTDAVVLDWSALADTVLRASVLLPSQRIEVMALYYSGASAQAVRMYFATAALAAEENRVSIVDGTLAQASRSCLWVPRIGATGLPMALRIERPAAINSTVRLLWQVVDAGDC